MTRTSGERGEKKSTVVLGIDPGTAVTGFGVVARVAAGRYSLLECGVIRTTPKEPLQNRIREVFEGLQDILEKWTPELMVVEDVFQGKNVRSALTLGHARGAILLAGSLHGVELVEYTPREIKKAVVGTGDATKKQVAHMVQRHLRLKDPPTPSDAADGVAAALCHCMNALAWRRRELHRREMEKKSR